MRFTTGSAMVGLGVFVLAGPSSMSPAARGSFTVGPCASARFCRLPARCVFPGSNADGPAVVSDLPDGVSSDGRGPYVKGKDGMWDVRAGQEGTLTIFDLADTVKRLRTYTVNLNKPVSGGGGVPLGIASSGNPGGFITQRTMVGDTIQNLINIPIGDTDTAAMMTIGASINGRAHVLQMGPQIIGHCGSGPNVVRGTGTSRGTITRVSATKWAMDLPKGSIGRLFDVQGPQRQPGQPPQFNYEHAVDRGLYYVHLHYEVGR